MIQNIISLGKLIQGLKGYRNICMTAKNCNMFSTLAVSVLKPYVYHVELNRPKKHNALNNVMWQEFRSYFQELAENPECRVIVLSGSGQSFCAGLDIQDAMAIGQTLAEEDDVARKCKILLKKIKEYQESLSAIEKCPKPVIAAVHGACIGAGIDMISTTDMRYCSADAWFQIKEIDLGMAADVGTLQRFPKVVGNDSLVRELIYTGRKFSAAEAFQYGFVSKVFDDEKKLMEGSLAIAEQIANKSPVAVQGSKLSLNYSRDHTVQEGLDHIAMYNQVMLQSEDFINAVVSSATKGNVVEFSKL